MSGSPSPPDGRSGHRCRATRHVLAALAPRRLPQPAGTRCDKRRPPRGGRRPSVFHVQASITRACRRNAAHPTVIVLLRAVHRDQNRCRDRHDAGTSSVVVTDTLSDVLRAVRLTGAFYFSIHASAPWVVETRGLSTSSPRRSASRVPFSQSASLTSSVSPRSTISRSGESSSPPRSFEPVHRASPRSPIAWAMAPKRR